MKHRLLLFALVLLPLLAAAQTTYYVDGATGRDANVGTSLAAPWRTLQKACDAATPGSTVLVRGGSYHENLVVHVSGQPGQPIIFRGYRAETAIVDGTGTSGTTLLRVGNRSYLRFVHLTFANLTAADAQGILVETTGTATATDLAFTAVTIRNIRWTANAATVPGPNNNAQAFVAYGRQGGLTKLTLDSCEVRDNVLGFSEALTLEGNVSGFAVRHCRVHDNTNIGIDLTGHYNTSPDPATDQARNGVVQANECYRNVSAYATAAGIYVDGGRDVVLDGNRCYENGWGIEVGAEENGTVTGVQVINNLVYHNQQGGLALGGYTTATTGQVTGAEIRNNTFLLNNTLDDGTGEISLTKASACRLENNVFYTRPQGVLLTADDIDPQTGNVLDYNIWYTPAGNPASATVSWRGTTYSSFVAYQAGTGQEAHSRYVAPGLVAATAAVPDAHLLPASPCRAAANPATVFRAGETDFDSRPRTGRTDCGALLYVGSVTATLASQAAAPLHLYPTPAHSQVQVQVPFARYALALYDSQGRLLRALPADATSLSVSDLPAGLYLLRAVSADTGQTVVARLVRE